MCRNPVHPGAASIGRQHDVRTVTGQHLVGASGCTPRGQRAYREPDDGSGNNNTHGFLLLQHGPTSSFRRR